MCVAVGCNIDAVQFESGRNQALVQGKFGQWCDFFPAACAADCSTSKYRASLPTRLYPVAGGRIRTNRHILRGVFLKPADDSDRLRPNVRASSRCNGNPLRPACCCGLQISVVQA